MNPWFHLSIHLFFSLVAGLVSWYIWKKKLVSFMSALLGGFFVDFDHFLDYFLAFGWHFRPDYFIKGYQFLRSDKLYIIFHGWEYVGILMVLVFLAKNKTVKTVFFGLALGLFFHLCVDVLVDRLPVASYLVTYRAKNNFDLQKLVYPEHWQEHLEQKKW
jgi:hypothetical protein